MMKIIEKIKAKQANLRGAEPVTVVCFGDSVTQGCFECYEKTPNCVETVFEYGNAYAARLRELLNTMYPMTQINVINSGISGDSAKGGAGRLERDVLSYHPDLVVVSFGLNDSCSGDAGLETYRQSMETIFRESLKSGAEVIFLTPNYMADRVSPTYLHDPYFTGLAGDLIKVQNGKMLEKYLNAAKMTAEELGVTVCDLYSVWDKMSEAGVNTTELLSNKLNHPIREYHYYIAVKLIEKMLGV